LIRESGKASTGGRGEDHPLTKELGGRAFSCVLENRDMKSLLGRKAESPAMDRRKKAVSEKKKNDTAGQLTEESGASSRGIVLI